MRKYLQGASMNWQVRVTYRANIWLETCGNLITMIVTIAVWLFAFQQTGNLSFGGYSQTEMIAYLVLAGLITSTMWHTAQGDFVMNTIRNGNLSRYLIRPYSFTGDYLMSQMMSNCFRFLITGTIFTAILLFSSLPIFSAFKWTLVPYFFLLLIPGVLIQYLVFYNAALMAFWMEEGWGMTFLIRVLAEVAAGSFIPLTLFAPSWQTIFNLLPFKYIIAVPVSMLLGRIPVSDLPSIFMGSIAWLVGLSILTGCVWKAGVRHYSAVGN